MRDILEECENSLVNGEKQSSFALGHPDHPAEPKPTDPKTLLELVNFKNAKNDLKDDVRSFTGYLVKLGYFLLSEPRDKSKQIASDHLHKLNLELFKRRSGIINSAERQTQYF